MSAAAAANDVRLQPCREPRELERLLRRDFRDAPVNLFPPSLLRALARDWLPKRQDVLLLVAEVDGQYAGQVFGHTLGRSVWRQFVRDCGVSHLPSLAYVWLRQRLQQGRRPMNAGYPADRAAVLRDWNVPRDRAPFAWSTAPNAGRVDWLFVAEEFRGRGVAAQLLQGIVDELTRQGCGLVEAHVNSTNLPSVRAFLKAGWEARQKAGNDFLVSYRRPESSPQEVSAP